MTVSEKLQLLREKMALRALDAYYIPSADPHMSEYLPENYKTRQYMSGFTGSAGTLLVLKDEAFLWTDGRYFIQAENELAGSPISLCKMGEKGVPTLFEFLQKRFDSSCRLGMDGKVLSVSTFKDIKFKLPQIECVTDIDLVGEIWQDRPNKVASKAFLLDEKYTGESISSKIARLRQTMTEKEVTSAIFSALDDVCYLYNIRASDVQCNPVITSYAIVDKENAYLFVNKGQLSDEILATLSNHGVTVLDYEEVFTEAEKLKGVVFIDPSVTNLYLFNKIKARIIEGQSFVVDMKSCKNDTEIGNIRKAMISDGTALVKFLHWLSLNVESGLTETDVVKKLYEFRALDKDFITNSFETIAGYASNGAVIHYKPLEGQDKRLEPKSFLLLDSGAHYYTGTTDITRTIPLGELTDAECLDYTLVLKAHIGLAMARFKNGATGFALDTIARKPLWAFGKDYNHGTGHGVGFVLSVHEGPQSISQRNSPISIKEGMLTSNEPGIYIPGKYGIRIENLILSKTFAETNYGKFLEFETVTLCPISTKPVKKELLEPSEIAWLNDYNALCCKMLSKNLTEEEKAFLEAETKAI